MATRVDGYEAEDDRKGVGRSSGGECLCPPRWSDRLQLGEASVIKKVFIRGVR